MRVDQEDGDIFERINDRWPAKEDRLVVTGRDVWLGTDGPERSYRLLRGYKRAGDLLIQEAFADPAERRNLVYPALFNYRHYVELALKATVQSHGSVIGMHTSRANHQLPELWVIFKDIAAAFGNSCKDEASLTVGRIINEFDMLDRRSTSFRYASDRNGCIPPMPTTSIDIMNIHDVMNGIENYFECAVMDFEYKQ